MLSDNIPKRTEIPAKFTWNLSDIYENDDLWNEDYKSLKQYSDRILSYKGHLADSADNLLGFFKLEDEISLKLSSLLGYANCKSDEDTSNNFYQDLKGKAIGVYTEISGLLSFSAPEIMDIPEEKLNSFYNTEPKLYEYKRSIYSIRRKSDHILSPESEKLLADCGEMSESAANINGIFHNSDLHFPDITDKSGKVHKLTDGTFVPLLENKNQDFRKLVFETYYKQIDTYKNTVAATLDAQFKQLCFFAHARRYSTTIDAALDSNEIDTGIYKNLIATVHNNLDKMHRYVALRKKMLGVNELHMYDVYTPLIPDATVKIDYNTAKSTVLEALSVLGKDYTATLTEGFNNRWIDVYENAGKRSGAYSTDFSNPHPFVLLNHKDNLDSMFTIAHEMGHALHSYYSTKNQPISDSNYVIFVAEVASTCNEVLLMKYLLKNTDDKKQRAYLINHFLDQFKGTLYRQTMFAEFELIIGKLSEEGATLTADLLNEKYLDLNRRYFGDEMISDPQIALEWARIPHFFYNYYVFQYATGFSAAVAIAERILKYGKLAIDDYKKFLSGGSSTDPISLLKIAGVDMSSAKPIEDALDLFEKLIEELEQIDCNE